MRHKGTKIATSNQHEVLEPRWFEAKKESARGKCCALSGVMR